MSQPNENHEPTAVEELHDRLMDRALTEVVGGETPTDLSARILAAEFVAKPPKIEVPTKWRFPRISWVGLAVAASLLVCGYALLLSATQSARETSWWSASSAMQRSRATTPPSLVIPDSGKQSRPSDEGEFDLIATTQATADTDALDAKVASVKPFPTNLSQVVSKPQSLGENVVGTEGGSHRFRLEPASSSEVQRYTAYFSQEQLARGAAGETRWGYEAGLRDESVLERQWRRGTREGTGPGLSGDQYTRIYENPFIKAVGGDAVSTFSIDVDTASYANVRQFLMDMRQLPPPDAVRIEELVNYFDYDYAGPNSEDDAPFAAHVEAAGCPWAPDHRLVRIGIKGREMDRDKRPASNLVFLVDVSGSMDEPAKLPLVVEGLQQLIRELGENDRVAIVVYASSEGLVLPSTPGSNQRAILAALGQLQAGGSTAGGAGIQLAYQIAEDHFIPGGTNRVILCTDGDFNVGVTSTAELERIVVKKAKETGVFLSVLGFGRGNLNDAMMQTIADRGNGNHYYVDNRREARKVLVEELTGTLVTIAKDVKIQVEFNPAQVAGYRLLGYENRLLRTEDFNDDTKDAGEIGAGHTVTALYEVIPAGKPVDVPAADELKYQPSPQKPAPAASRELLTLKMRYKQPEGDVSRKLEWPVTDEGRAFTAATDDFQFAAAVAGFGLLLRDSEYKGTATYDAVAEIAQSSLGDDAHGYRKEFVGMIRRARELQPGR